MATASSSDPDEERYVKELGLVLHRRRVEVGLTQEQLAHSAGLTRSHYQQLEKGQSRPGVAANPSLRTLTRLAAVLGIEIEDLLVEARELARGRRRA